MTPPDMTLWHWSRTELRREREKDATEATSKEERPPCARSDASRCDQMLLSYQDPFFYSRYCVYCHAWQLLKVCGNYFFYYIVILKEMYCISQSFSYWYVFFQVKKCSWIFFGGGTGVPLLTCFFSLCSYLLLELPEKVPIKWAKRAEKRANNANEKCK